jgi:hypothetical protein
MQLTQKRHNVVPIGKKLTSSAIRKQKETAYCSKMIQKRFQLDAFSPQILSIYKWLNDTIVQEIHHISLHE